MGPSLRGLLRCLMFTAARLNSRWSAAQLNRRPMPCGNAPGRSGYASDFGELYGPCRERGVAFQIIKSIARRRWTEADEEKRFSWYRPIRATDALRRAVHFVLWRPGLFLNTSSDTTLLRATLEAAAEVAESPDEEAMRGDSLALGIEPLFVRGVSDEV